MADILEQYMPQQKKKGPSMVVQIAVLAVMTIAAVGVGWFSGSYLNSSVPQPAAGAEAAAGTEPAAEAPPSAEHGGGGGEHGGGGGEHGGGGGEHGGGAEGEGPALAKGPLLFDLAPITTNLVAPAGTWLRLEVALQFDEPVTDPNLVDTIHQDLLAYTRTLKLHQIEGASGFRHLKEDLTERASVRSDGHVKAVLIRTFLFE